MTRNGTNPYGPGVADRSGSRRAFAALLTGALAVAAAVCAVPSHAATADAVAWPTAGQGAIVIGSGSVLASPGQRSVPIASVAKVMTAVEVLRSHPLAPGAQGPTLTVSRQDVIDTAVDRTQDQSVVAVATGERLTERQALEGLLLPSGNNIAQLLARWAAGSHATFVARMNADAGRLGLHHTRYTDPSGFAASTVSTAADQVLLIRAAMADPTFATIVAMPTAVLPVAGRVLTTDHILGIDGVLGGKTGSDTAAGGCFVFAEARQVAGRPVTVYGAVLGQPGPLLVTNALHASETLADAYLGMLNVGDAVAVRGPLKITRHTRG